MLFRSGVEQVPTESDFFEDLGADSLVMAQFCARVRKQPDLPTISIKDIYQHRTIAALATALAPAEPVGVAVPVFFLLKNLNSLPAIVCSEDSTTSASDAEVKEFIENNLSAEGLARTQARAMLETSYAWLDARMADREWAAGTGFTLADCAAAPFLFYADWTHRIDTRFANVLEGLGVGAAEGVAVGAGVGSSKVITVARSPEPVTASTATAATVRPLHLGYFLMIIHLTNSCPVWRSR